MKVIFQKSNLLNGLNIVLKAAASKTTMSILECILIDAASEEVTLTANNTELGIETKVKADVQKKGKTAIDAKLFSEIVRRLPENDIILEIKQNIAHITCENAQFKIPCRDAEDFTNLPKLNREEYICISQFTLKK